MNNIKKTLKTSNGITLIALVITIIVLLILAGISISMLSGDNGLLTKAGDAKTQTGIGQEKEIVALAYNSTLAKKVSNGDSTVVTAGDLNIELANQGATADGSNPIKVTFTNSKRQYIINSNGIIDEYKKEEMPIVTTPPTTAVEKNTKYNDGTNIAVIPKGFRVSSNTDEQNIATGLVVYDGNDNEWVWIPIDNPSIMYTQLEEGSEIAITGGDGLNIVNDIKTRKYSNTILNNKTRGLPNVVSSNYREPDIVVANDGNSYDVTNYEVAGFNTLKDMAKGLVEDYEEMIESVKNNGGFYVGRYEITGSDIENAAEKAGSSMTNKNWYQLYYACKNIKTGSSGIVESRMIWGCQWDMVCNFIANSGDKKNITDSASWGNYWKTTVKASNGVTTLKLSDKKLKLDTGITTFTKANEIYDIAGNCYEWTQEAFHAFIRVARGGSYGTAGNTNPASARTEWTTASTSVSDLNTSRAILYIK